MRPPFLLIVSAAFSPTLICSVASADTCVPTANCNALGSCSKIETQTDLEAYTCFSYYSRRSCSDTVKNAPSPLTDAQIFEVEYYFRGRGHAEICELVPFWLKGPVGLSLIKWRNDALNGGRLSTLIGDPQHVIQVIPGISASFPIAGQGNGDIQTSRDATNFTTSITVRYSPISHLAGVEAFIGASSVASDKLDRMLYPDPRLEVFGLGAYVFGGLFGFHETCGTLTTRGYSPTGRTKDCWTDFFIDGAAAVSILQGLAK